MNKPVIIILALLLHIGVSATTNGRYVAIDGVNLVQPDGKKLYIVGTNLGNWLNPEGYMFGFKNTNSEWMIDDMARQIVGPDAADEPGGHSKTTM